MNTLNRLKIIRSITTIVFASLIFIAGLFPEKNLRCAASVFAGCVLGGIQGTGAAGLCIIVEFVINGFSFSEKYAIFMATFVSSLVSGILARKYSFLDEMLCKKNVLTIAFASAIGFLVFYVLEVILSESKIDLSFIYSDILKCVSVIIASTTLKPLIEKKLYPKSELENELEENISKLKTKL